MNYIKFKPENIYDLGILDSKGNPIKSNSIIECSRVQAPQFKVFRMYEHVYYMVLKISLREIYLDFKVHHYYLQKDFSPAYAELFEDSDEKVFEYSLGSIQDVRYFGKHGIIL